MFAIAHREAQLRKIIGSTPAVLQTIKPRTLVVTYWPGIRFADGSEAMLGEKGVPKPYKTWQGAYNRAGLLLIDMQKRARQELNAAPSAESTRRNGEGT